MIGTMQKMVIKKLLPFGAILGDEEILLPKKYLPEQVQIGESVEVFIHTDSQDRIIATTLKPLGLLNEIVALEIVDIVDNGAYLNLGIAKDVFMPCKNPKSYQKGQKVIVQLTKDKQERLLGTQNLKFFKCNNPKKTWKCVWVIPYRQTPLGYECVVDKKYSGMLYHNELFDPIILGESYEAQIKKVRLDGKLDLKIVSESPEKKLLRILKENGGKLALHSKSSPEKIYQMCQMSKKNFKKALTSLAPKVGQNEEGIFISNMVSNMVQTQSLR